MVGRIFFLVIIALAVIVAVNDARPFNETMDGPRNLGQMYNFTLKNISGTRAWITYHFSVYDFRIMNSSIHIWSRDDVTWKEKDADPGKVYLAVWVRVWCEGTPYIDYKPRTFRALWKNYEWIYPEPVILNDRPEYYDLDHYSPAEILETYHRVTPGRGVLPVSWYGYIDGWERDEMIPGRSNGYDGFILFQVPAGSRPEDLQIAGVFPTGSPLWMLSPGEIIQLTPAERIEIERQKAREVLTGRIAEIRRTQA